MAFSRGDVAASTLFYNQPNLIGEMRRLVAHNPHFQAVYVTPDYSIYRWLPPPPRRRRATANAYGVHPAARPARARCLRDRVYRGRRHPAGRRTRKATTPTKSPTAAAPTAPITAANCAAASPAPRPLATRRMLLARRAASAWRTYARSVSSERLSPSRRTIALEIPSK